MDKQPCGGCHELFDRDDLFWVNDNYGIPYKKVCNKCYPVVKEEISSYVFDEADAGEQLDPEPDVFGRGFEW